MKKILTLCFTVGAIAMLMNSCSSSEKENTGKETITFYEVPLVCGAAPEIGCGSRIKPLFIDTEKEESIKESWSNRPGTIIAIKWSGTSDEKLIQTLFKKHSIDAKLIVEDKEIEKQTVSLGKDKWYKGMDVDQLSLEEAGVIAESMTSFAKDDGLINDDEAKAIKTDMENYFKKELVIVRTCEELKSEETQDKWRKDGYEIYVTHIGKERADSVSAAFAKMYEESCKIDSACTDKEKKDCCKKKTDE